MRPYRQHRLARAWGALLPESVPPIVRFAGLVLMGLFLGIPWMILILIARVTRAILVGLYRMGEKTYTSMMIVVNDPDG